MGERSTASKVFPGVLALLLAAASSLPATAQDARWRQLTEQASQLRDQGKAAQATPVAQEAVRVAQATYGPDRAQVALSLNLLGLLLKEQEKFADAETALRSALAINVKVYGQESRDVATVMNNLADLYRVEGKYADGEKMFLQALSIHEKLLGPNDPAVATDANNLAVLYIAEGRYADAEPLYRRATAIDEKALAPGDEGLAKDYNNLGDLEEKQGKYADAEALYSKSLGIDLKLHGKDHPVVATDLSNLGVLYMEEGKNSTAEAIFVRVLAVDEETRGPESTDTASVLDNMAALYQAQGRYPEAEPLLRRALAIFTKVLGPDHPEVATNMNNLGALYAAEGRYAEADTFYHRALDIREKKFGQMHPLVALSLANLALLDKDEGKWSDAEAMYRQAMAIDLKVLGEVHPRVAALLNNMATMYIDEGKFADAERLLRGAVAIDEKVYGPNHPATAQSLNNLAEVLREEGKPADAEPLYQQSLAINEKALGPNHPDVADNLIGLASTYQEEGKYPEAEPLFQRAVTIYEGAFGPDHPKTGEAQMNLAVFYYGWDKPEQAAPYFDRRLGNLIDQFKSNATYMSERDRLTFLGTVPGAFPLYFSFALKYHDRDPALAAKAYDLLLQEKGFIAASSASMRAKVLASGDKDSLALLDKLTAKKTQLAAIVASSQGDPADRRKQIGQLSQETNQIEQDMVKRSSALAEQKSLSSVTWRDVQKALKPGDAAVELTRFQFHNGKSFTNTFYYIALVVTPESTSPQLVVLGEAQKLESAPMASYRVNVALTRGLSEEPAPGDMPTPGPAAAGTSAAYDAFWKPLEPALANVKRVYVSPDGVLNQVPIGLLADSSGKLLLEKYEIRYVNSTKDLLRPKRAATSKTAVLLGNPKFDLTEADQRAALAKLGMAAAPAATLTPVAMQSGPTPATVRGSSLNPLPSTQVEVDAIGKLLKGAGWQVTPYTDDLALEEVMQRARSPRIVHIATHGFFLTDQEVIEQSKASGGQHIAIADPMLRSGLFFAGANRIRSGAAPAAGLTDGMLTAYEASQLDLEGTELVVLSACETGLGQQSNGEGVFGLRRGLQEAGADAVLMSMWSVPDRETQELMGLFYANWLGGMEKPEAFRQAQLKERETVRQRYGKDLPFYWGAFVLVSR